MDKKFNWMPVLRTGTFTDKNNQTVTIDEAALDKIIAATDFTKEPQLVVEHPKFDEIGFGTIDKIKRVGGILFALPKTVLEKFKKAVNSGKLPGRSVTLDKNSYALRNISFLPPDVPPAVSGLGAYSFSEDRSQKSAVKDEPRQRREVSNSESPLPLGEGQGEGVKLQMALPGIESHFARLISGEPGQADLEFAEYEVSSWPFKTIQIIFRSIKNYIIEKDSLEVAEQMIPEFYLSEVGNPPSLIENSPLGRGEGVGFSNTNFQQNINGDTMKVDLKTIDLSKADPQLKAAIEELQADNTKLTTDLTAKNVELQTANTKITAAESEKLRNEVIQFCEGADIKKKIKPADKEKFVNFLVQLIGKPVIEFSAADGTKVQLNNFEFAKELVKILPDFISDSEIATGSTAGIADAENAELLAQKALEFQSAELKEGRTVSASAAVAHVKMNLK
jgi:hypothetical protein